MKKIYTEEFENIQILLKILNERPNNKVMKNEFSSSDGDFYFTGTDSYEEAVKLLRTGYTDIIKTVKSTLATITKANKHLNPGSRAMPRNNIMGYVPNVPNAIIGLPESMINTDLTPQKRKTISIVYSMDGNCCEETDFFIKTGTVLLAAINIIELSGIQVKLSVGFMAAETNKELTFPIVSIKNYGQRLDLLKTCFPLAHPSMMRRIGFKWLETTPQITDENYSCGYGRDPKDLKIITDVVRQNYNKNSYVLNTHWIRDNDYSVEKLLTFLDFNVKDGN